MLIRGSRLFTLVFAFAAMGACSSDESNLEVDQTVAFEKYLQGDTTAVYVLQEGVFRQTVYTDTVNVGVAVEYGDSVYFDFAIHPFTNAGPAMDSYYFTNRPHWMAGDTLTNHRYWPYGDAGIELGSTAIVRGLERGLPGSRERDSILIYVPSKLGYGGTAVGAIPKDSPLVWGVHIKKVVK